MLYCFKNKFKSFSYDSDDGVEDIYRYTALGIKMASRCTSGTLSKQAFKSKLTQLKNIISVLFILAQFNKRITF
jgi:hypothetical protein